MDPSEDPAGTNYTKYFDCQVILITKLLLKMDVRIMIGIISSNLSCCLNELNKTKYHPLKYKLGNYLPPSPPPKKKLQVNETFKYVA